MTIFPTIYKYAMPCFNSFFRDATKIWAKNLKLRHKWGPVSWPNFCFIYFLQKVNKMT